MKKKLKYIFVILISISFFCCSGPEQMKYTDSEIKWNDSIEKVYPYDIVLFKGILMNGVPDCGDSSFKIYVYYLNEKDMLDSTDKLKNEAKDIAKSYSKIRDYKDCVEFIYVKFIDTTNYKNNFGCKYDIINDKMQSGIEVY